MKERSWIEPIVERVVGQVLDSHAAQLRSEIVRDVMQAIAVELEHTEMVAGVNSSAETSHPANLARAVAEIQLGTSQKEILRALLDTSSRYGSRVALFVVKGSYATGWEARGFVNGDAVKDFALDGSAPAVVRAIGDRMIVASPLADLDAHFLREFGAPSDGEIRIFPLILKDKVAALLYADGGTGAAGVPDAGALELLVLSTSAWLEVNSLRKQVQKEPSHADMANEESHRDSIPSSGLFPSQPVSAFSDPFASHAPAFSSGQVMAAAASASAAPVGVSVAPVAAGVIDPQASTQASVAEAEPPLVEHEPVGLAYAPVSESQVPVSVMTSEEQDVQRKAQRFARLLVDEIKLYNQAKVAEGRKNRDLYDRLRETIEKSRATYHKRYGNTVAASGDYFQHEIIRSLAEDDLSIMGANFRH